jgi:hypothetical protein
MLMQKAFSSDRNGILFRVYRFFAKPKKDMAGIAKIYFSNFVVWKHH